MCDHIHNANAFGFRCPACGDGSRLDIQAHVWVTLTEDGTDPNAAHDMSHHSSAPLVLVNSDIHPADRADRPCTRHHRVL